MAKYLVTELSFIDGALVEPGTEIEFAGEPGPNLEPLDKAAEKAFAAASAVTPAKLSEDLAKAAAGETSGEIDLNDLARQSAAADSGNPEAGESLM